MKPPNGTGNQELIALIHDEIIANGGRIVFARFMELALYHPIHGYYMSESRRPGRGGDFITAPEVTAHFGHAVARQMAECWERLGSPDEWSIREYGAGIGGLAYDIMAGLATDAPRAFEALTYHLVELNPFQRAEASRSMTEIGLAGKVVIESPDVSTSPITGVILANEVADALPIHRLEMTEEGWMEGYVFWDGDGFDWTLDEFSPEAEAAFMELADANLDFSFDDIVEVSPATAAWFDKAIEGLERGYVVIIDYGYPATVLYSSHRLDGTLRGYSGHTVSDDPFTNVGLQDLTAHVDFTSLRKAGEASGLTHAGYTMQGACLSSLGLGDVLVGMQDDPAATIREYLATQAVILRLIDPGGLGRFGVMIMARDAPVEPPLRAFKEAPPDF
ncbi:SAM-dependent methyltransferase [soil metagenome]